VAVDCLALSKAYETAFQRALIDNYYEGYEYCLGGRRRTLKKKHCLDCSGFIGKSAVDAGIPGVEEDTQAFMIFAGRHGYKNRAVRVNEEWKPGDIFCLAVPGSLDRDYNVNHVGAGIRRSGQWKVIDCAGGKVNGVRIGDYEGIWQKYLAPNGHLRWIHGEKK